MGYGLAGVRMFIGGKMLLADLYKVPIGAALVVVVGMLVAAMLLSLPIAPRAANDPGAPSAAPPSSAKRG